MLVTIDPGFGGTGFAVWDGPKLIESGVVRVSSGIAKADRIMRMESLTNDLLLRLVPFEISRAVIELPELWGGSATSYASISTGDLIALAVLVGSFARMIDEDFGAEVGFLKPSEWKGQLSKKAVISRIKRELPDLVRIRDHEADAIGIGLAIQGRL